MKITKGMISEGDVFVFPERTSTVKKIHKNHNERECIDILMHCPKVSNTPYMAYYYMSAFMDSIEELEWEEE